MVKNKTNEQQTLLAWLYESECEEYSEQLYLCAESECNNESIEERFAAVLAHRTHCARCAETYAELLFMLRLETTDGLLTYETLQPMDAITTPTSAQRAAQSEPHQTQTPVAWAVEQMETGMRVLINLTALFTQPTLAWATRGQSAVDSTASHQKLVAHTGGAANEIETEIQLTLAKDENDQQKLVLQAEVNVPDRWPDFSGIRIVLRSADGQIRRLVTSRSGIVRFTGMSLADLLDASIAVEVPVSNNRNLTFSDGT